MKSGVDAVAVMVSKKVWIPLNLVRGVAELLE